MACAACGRQNLLGAKVCEACGAPLGGVVAEAELVIELADAPPSLSPPSPSASSAAAAGPVTAAQAAVSASSAGRAGAYAAGLLVVVILALGAWWWRVPASSQKVAPPLPPSTTSASERPAVDAAPVPSAVAPVAAQSQPEMEPAGAPLVPGPIAQAAIAQVVGPNAKAAAKPTTAQILAAARALRPPPASCEAGVHWLVVQYAMSVKTAQKLAARAFEAQCADASSKVLAVPVVEPLVVPNPVESAPAAVASSIDEQYNQRVAAECARGLFGVVCRDRVKNELCKGRFSAHPPAGESRCKQGLQQDSRDH